MRLRTQLRFEADDVILCNVSRLSWEKRPLELIDLFLQVKGKKKFKLIIVGNGPLEEELNEKIRKNGLEKEVKIYPNVPYEKMWEIYEMSDYYLNMNKGEIFGMAKRICRKSLKKWRLHLPGTAAQMPFYRHLLKKAAGKNRNSICQYGKSRV